MNRILLAIKVYVCCCMPVALFGLFESAQVARAYSLHDFAKAQVKNDLLLTESPRDPVVLYNAGKIAAKQSKMQSAEGYFEQAINVAESIGNKQLQEQAQFDLGIAQAAQQKYEEAIISYQKVLDLNPTNKFAQENKKIIEELLEKQKQEDKSEQQEKDKKGNGDKDSSNQKDKQEQGENKQQTDDLDKDQEKDEQQQKDKKHTDSNKQSDSEKDNSKDTDKEKKEQDSQSDEQSKEQEKKSEQDKKRKDAEDQLQKHLEESGKENVQEANKPDAGDTKQNEAPAQQSEGKQNQQDKQLGFGQKTAGTEQEAGAAALGKEAELPLDERQKRLLSLIEQADEQAGKNLVQRAMAERMRGSSGEKNW